jgi:AraC-like DNA-binding protein
MKNIVKERYRRPMQPDVRLLVQPVFDDFHRLRVLESCEYPEHRHGNYEWILIEKGTYRCRLNDVELTLNRGQILVVKPEDVHQDHFHRGQQHYVLHFHLVSGSQRLAEPPSLFRSGVSAEQQVCRGNHGRESVILRELRRESIEGGDHAPRVQDALLEALFWRTIRDLLCLSPQMRRLPQEEALRQNIAAVMGRRLETQLTVDEIAEELSMSPRHLTSLCRRLFGESPARLFLLIKLRRAEEMLLKRDKPIKEISRELGFANPYHFSRVFRRLMGRPPSKV